MNDVPSGPEDKKAIARHLADLCLVSNKFLLPEGGLLLEDNEFRAIDESVPIRLPYPFVAFEFLAKLKSGKNFKIVLFCREHEDEIYIRTAVFNEAAGYWVFKKECSIPVTGGIDRSENPRNPTIVSYIQPDDEASEYFVKVVLSFINALACSNVKIERSNAPKQKVKSALQFDSYHILTIDRAVNGGNNSTGGSHRSPREHLRRGHIRRLADGRKIWVNACAVGAGNGAGKITKDYSIRCAA